MTETTTKPAVCEAIKPHSNYPWRCQLRAGHDPATDHRWPIEAVVGYGKPLDQHDAAWLAAELGMKLAQIEDLKREHRESARRTEQTLAALLAGLIELAPGNSTRKNVRTEDVQALWMKAIHG